MSDFEGDFDDELLELAGATEKKRKHQASSSRASAAKKRRTEVSDDSDAEDGPESEEESDVKFPLEGKYIDESDRERLLSMPEIEREEILAGRQEELMRIQDKRKLHEMLQAQSGDPESISKAAKRQRTSRGATKEKSRTLDELKARRKAKDEKKRTKTHSPKRDRSSSPNDMDMSSGEEEDGQITRYEEEEEKDRKLFSRQPDPADEPSSLEDLMGCRLTRDHLAKFCMAPWFEDYVKGGWVRYLVGQDEKDQPQYRICEIQNLGVNLTKPYKINDVTVNQTLELKHGKSLKAFHMDKVSNAPFTQREFERLGKVCLADDVKLPSKRALEKKVAQMSKLITQPMTESDITAMLARKSQLSNLPSGASLTLQRSSLVQARTLAIRRQDYAEVSEIDVKLAELPAVATPPRNGGEESLNDKLAKVNERNRKANLEGIRKAEMLEAERKRRERKLNASGTATPADPSARLKTVPRLFNDTISRSGTPNINGTGTPALQAHDGAGGRSISPLPPLALSDPRTGTKKDKSLEVSVIEMIEVDLGDF
ncbi:uncharacterized protein F5891DRAFT_1017998 [Suillus fuscotomentosus]|uniref:Plus3 domain-containing protein n=1 Tax=Suillus fuscotomentosus TaxID=1912939 RepID=A0AAD4ECS0_9AGAM|nr:uncharacterized protein F5891DRAFT_1017998 [Suillus fuscotomentosus]KAG1903725.1 hypothetical protein F5891DRAFT_1017998 [Suillus fuscotomentosus]